MNLGRTTLTGLMIALLAAGSAASALWLAARKPAGAAKPAPPPLPANVPKILKEDDITAFTLTPDGLKALALKTDRVVRKSVKRSRVYGGEVMIPVGQSVIVSAPLSGTLSASKEGIPRPGRSVTKGQAMFRLSPLLTPEGRVNITTATVEAEGQVESTQATLEGATIALGRARRLLKSDAGSRRAVDEAQALYDVAKKTHEAAVARRALLQKVAGSLDKGVSAPLVIESPEAGLLRNVSALPGQTVPSGAVLFEVVNLTRVWVRVPVYVGDLPDIDTDGTAIVGGLTDRPDEMDREAKPTTAPPSANPSAGTVDLYYALDNDETRYEPGRRVGVSVPLTVESDSLTVPWSAVIVDIHGGTWVYERTAERRFLRRRVSVRFVRDSTAVLADGPPAGTVVVTAGAAELFGVETGFSK